MTVMETATRIGHCRRSDGTTIGTVSASYETQTVVGIATQQGVDDCDFGVVRKPRKHGDRAFYCPPNGAQTVMEIATQIGRRRRERRDNSTTYDREVDGVGKPGTNGMFRAAPPNEVQTVGQPFLPSGYPSSPFITTDRINQPPDDSLPTNPTPFT